MYLLFDFDGTLVQSFDCVMKKTNRLAQKFNFKIIKPQETAALRDLTSYEVIKFLGIPMYKIPLLIGQMRKELRKEMITLKPVDNILPVLKQLKEEGSVLGILTSNSTKNVALWLKKHGLDLLFKFIHSEPTYFSKRILIKKTLLKYNIPAAEAIYICDEIRDISAAQRNQIATAAVTWGYNSEKVLAKMNPTFLINHSSDLLKLITADFNEIKKTASTYVPK